jgi:hypothetical protein
MLHEGKRELPEGFTRIRLFYDLRALIRSATSR